MRNIRKIFILTLICITMIILNTHIAHASPDKTGIVNADVLNFRVEPDLSSKIILQLREGTKVEVLGDLDGWYKISFNNITGWVYGKYLSVEEESHLKGVISATNVNIRSGPSTENYVLRMLNKGEEVYVTGRSKNWYSIRMDDGLDAWIYGELLNVTGTASSSRNFDTGTQIVQYAKNFLGIKYVYGGDYPSQGLDCSGFVKYVYDNFDIDIMRVAADQAAQGKYVDISNLRLGDLVFFDTDGGHNYINHVGIYIGGNKFIHASSGKGKVVISNLSGFYINTYMKAKRFTR